MPDPRPISVRPYRPGDERALVELFSRAFGRQTSEEHWRWKLKAPSSTVDNVWLAVSDDQPVFQYAGIPTRFLLAQEPATAMVSVDTMTAPDFRRQGLLTRVASQVYAAWREQHIAFVIGLPNEQWGSRASALGWRPLFLLQWLVRPLRPEAILARRLNVAVLKQARFTGSLWNRLLQGRVRRDPQVNTERIRHADGSFDQLWDGCKSDWTFSAVRDRDWVNWRFLSAPSSAYAVTLARRDGKPAGYAAHRLITADGRVSAHLAELLTSAADDATRDSLLHDLIENLLDVQAESLFTLAVPGTRYFRWLRHAGFFPWHSFLVQLVPLRADLPVDLMLDPNRWNLSGADFDVI